MFAETRPKPTADNTPISEIMTRDVVCVSPELSVETLTVMMIERGFSGAPVVDASKRPIGVVSKTDILRKSIDGDTHCVERPRIPVRAGVSYDPGAGYRVTVAPVATVAEIMTPIAFTLSEQATIAEAAALMSFEGTHRVPVVSKNDVVVGIVSTLDVLRWIAQTDGYLVARPGHGSER